MNRLGGTQSTTGTGIGGAGAGPAASAASAAAQKQRTLLQRVDADVSNFIENFSHLLKAARVNETVKNSQESFQMKLHAARMAQAADSLLKLVSELKQSAVFSDFLSLNEHIDQRVCRFEEQTEEAEIALMSVGEQLATSLKDLETHYYISRLKSGNPRTIS